MDQSSTAWRTMLERAKLPEYARSSSAYIHGFLGLGERVIRLYTALKCGSARSRPAVVVILLRPAVLDRQLVYVIIPCWCGSVAFGPECGLRLRLLRACQCPIIVWRPTGG